MHHCRKCTDQQELEICRRYLDGENTTQLGKAFGVDRQTARNILDRHGVARRDQQSSHRRLLTAKQEKELVSRYMAKEPTSSLRKDFKCSEDVIAASLKRCGFQRRSTLEAHRVLSEDQESEVCLLYLAKESPYKLAKRFGVAAGTIRNIIIRNGIKPRSQKEAATGDGTDSVGHALKGTGYHAHTRECEFYLFELARYSDTHCKPGISFDIKNRVTSGYGEYGVEVLRLVFATRAEAYFLEQAVLDATRGSAECPDDLIAWDGASEIRAMPAADLLPIIDRLAAELEAMGPWAFAAAYVPMTTAQRATCQQRALLTFAS